MTETAHIGKKISRIRELRGMKQEVLAEALGISQQAVSKIEQSETIEENTLTRIAKALEVTPEAIKGFSEEVAINIISSSLHDNAGSINNHCTLTFNPIDKWVETLDENKKLYERLLQSEKEKVALLQKVLDAKK